MDDLVQFLRARLDEDDAGARAASWDEWDGNHWTAHHREQYDGRWAIIDRADEGVITTVDPQAADDAGVAQHIARHDPARILRQVEAKRQLLAEHQSDRFGGCATCARPRDFAIDAESNRTFYRAAKPWPCTTARLLALPYADHPDYREDWRP